MNTSQFNEQQMKLTKESVHQFRVCQWLDKNDLIYFAVPNGYKKSMFQQMQAKREGLRPGVPDIIIVSKNKQNQGTVLEMKRYKGAKHKLPCGCLDIEQAKWRDLFVKEGWTHVLAHGSDEAIGDLEQLYKTILLKPSEL